MPHPTPTLANQPPVDAPAYARYKVTGTGSIRGRIFVAMRGGDAIPPVGVPMYLIPATPYTSWYVGFHQLELERDVVSPPKTDWRGRPKGPPVDLQASIPFTAMEPVAFHAARTVKMTDGGYFLFTGIPPGSYFVLTHWPVELSSSMTVVQGNQDTAGGFNATSSEQRKTSRLIFWAVSTAPITIAPHESLKFVPTVGNLAAGGMNCGSDASACGRLLLDQWLPSDARM